MTIALALMFGAGVIAVHGHRWLARLSRARLDPRVGIVAWLMTMAGVPVTVAVAITVLALPDHGGLAVLLGQLQSCFAGLHHGALPEWELRAAALAGLVIIVVLIRAGLVGYRQQRRRRQRRDRYRFLIAALIATAGGGDRPSRVLWLPHPSAFAFSVAGRPGLIAASSGLRDRLTPGQVAAALAHEQACECSSYLAHSVRAIWLYPRQLVIIRHARIAADERVRGPDVSQIGRPKRANYRERRQALGRPEPALG